MRSVARPGEGVAVSTEGAQPEVVARREGDPLLSPGRQVPRRGRELDRSALRRGSKRLFEIRAAHGRSTQQAGYAVSPDGRRLLVLLLDQRAIPTQINVVQIWFEELKAKVPVR